MLKHIIFSSVFLTSFTLAYSQINIDFEKDSLVDWEQPDSIHWEISNNAAISDSFSLHHSFDNPESGHDQIALPLGRLDLSKSVTWKFKIRHGYSPSSSNNWSVFLYADGGAKQMTPDNQNNAYVVGVNFTGSDDTLKLWKKTGSKTEELANTRFNWQDNIGINDYAEFEITFSPPGNWNIKLFKNGDKGNNFQFELTSVSHIGIAHYFGIYYEYSSSQDQKLWFDDLEIDGFFIPDKTPPSLVSFSVQQDIIALTFSEPVSPKSINKNSISIDPEIYFEVVSENSTQLTLKFTASLEIDKAYTLYLKNLEDLSGNAIIDTSLTIQYSIARQNEIIISEIMTDPTPPVSLPEQEFIEIYNRSTKTFNLTNYSIWVGDKQQTFQNGDILPGQHIIICDDSDVEAFSSYGEVIEVRSLPNLTKASGIITLRNNLGQLVHQVEYNDNAYVSETKQQGGWTLEIVDPDNPCHYENNWMESEDPLGGTPGRQNSVFGDNKDFEPPKIENISITSDTSIHILLNEIVDSFYTAQNITFSLDEISDFELMEFNKIEAYFSKPLKTQKLYETTLAGIKDCAANEIDNTIYYPFAKTEEPDSLDIVFNEIMFDPEPNEPEYIELLNVSDRFLDLSCVNLLKRKSSGEYDTCLIKEISTLLLPEQLVVLSESNELMSTNYSINPEAIYIEMENFPALTNTSGVLKLQDTSGRLIDIFEYHESMHFDLLQESKGVSLEKINIENPSLDRNNWQSASASENYATPGWPNSQIFNYNSASYSPFTIEHEVFSPNYDGYNDELFIRYQFNETGIVINIRIYDAKGRLINQLANNFLCGTKGEFVWRGKNFDGAYALNGIYMIYIEYFDLEGNVSKKKETCVLAR